MKKNIIIFLDHWKKRNQIVEFQKKFEPIDSDEIVNENASFGHEFDAEKDEELLTGMIIW